MTVMQSLSSFVAKHSIAFSFKNGLSNFTVEGEEDSLDLLLSKTAPGGIHQSPITRSQSEESDSTAATSRSSASSVDGDSQESEGAEDMPLEQNISSFVEKHGIAMSLKNGFSNFTVEDSEYSLDLMRSKTAPGGMEENLTTGSRSGESDSTCEVATSCSSSSGTDGDIKETECAEDMQLEQSISSYVAKHSIAMSWKSGFLNFTVEGEDDSLDIIRSKTAPGGIEEKAITTSHSSREQNNSTCELASCCSSSISSIDNDTQEDAEEFQLEQASDWYPGPGLVDNCLPGAAGVSSILKLQSEGSYLEVLQWVIDPKMFDHRKSRLQRFSSRPFNASLPGFEGELEMVMRGVDEQNTGLSQKFSRGQGRRLMLRRALDKGDKAKSTQAIGEEVSVQFRIGAGRGVWSEASSQITTTIDPKKGEVREACFDDGFPELVVENSLLVIQVAIRLEEWW